MNINSTILTELQQLINLRMLLQRMTWTQKIAVAQIACNQIGSREPVQLIKLHPFSEHFDDQLQAAIILMGPLSPETLTEIALEILEEPRDQNE